VTPIRVYSQEEARRLGREPERQTTFRALEAAQAQDERGLLARVVDELRRRSAR
jgi:hypothetical protein